ncbi:MAG TPA: hypothetical protein PK208_01345 [Fibrobacteria bacterium]|nr:hypothetical protein [Fibrobacteria bacterium]
MKTIWIFGLLAAALLSGCGGSAPRMGADGAANLDAMARSIAIDYRERCFEPVLARKVPDDMCQFDLFDKAERQWGTTFGPSELKSSANKLLGMKIETELLKLLVYDAPSQRYVAASTRTRYEIIAALKDKYRIR